MAAVSLPGGGPGAASPRVARLYAALAFGAAAPVYQLLTDIEPWRRSCRALGALVPAGRILDVGIGPGASALEVADPSRLQVGLDLSLPMVRRAARAARGRGLPLSLVCGDAMDLPARDGAFDGVTGHSLLYLVPDPARVLAEVRRALRPGGRAAFLEPRDGALAPGWAPRGGARFALAMWMWRGMSRLHRRWDERSLAALLAAAGFREARAWPVLEGFGVMAVAERG
jgi:ubiquinone/menaquinone biosynthesis C-methylase UbiE